MTELPLGFQREILTEIVAEDGLLILARGLGLRKVLCSLLKLYTDNSHLVLLINSTPADDTAINDELACMGVPAERQMKVIEYETPAETRSDMYRNSGIFSITSRILAVDMLLKRIPTHLISGIVVHYAHSVNATSMESFILQLYREENEQGFIKAFSDQSESFVTGFAPLQNTLKSLFLRKVHLWPRFHVMVADDLESSNENIIELRQPMSEKMDKIQHSIVECMDACLSEIKRSNTGVDLQEFTVENSMFKSFDTIIRRQLDPNWHRVAIKTKQLVGDLKLLRHLLTYLAGYDCITFYSFLQTIMASNTPSDGKLLTNQSPWLLMDAANVIFSLSKKRFFVEERDEEYQSYEHTPTPGLPKKTKLVLEEQPKWGLLHDILEEIEHDIAVTNARDATILVMVDEQRTCTQLKEYISTKSTIAKNSSIVPILSRLARNYFRWKAGIVQINQQVKEELKDKSNTSRGGGSGQYTSNVRGGGAPPNKRRRVRGASAIAAASMAFNRPLADTFQQDITDNAEALDQENVMKNIDMGTPLDPAANLTDVMSHKDILPHFDEIAPSEVVTVSQYVGEDEAALLEQLQPKFIIMYDPNPAFVRRVELYRASHPDREVRVYFMIYDNSVEEQQYLSSIRQEKEAFEKLIREKSIMAVPIADSRKRPGEEDVFLKTISTRIGGGTRLKSGAPTVIVDMREFRSSLPPILHKEGMRIAPCTLQVGDYILSPELCVERKSITDLISSFSSGRLYTQCENMSLHYKTPVLLIEFDQNKSFSLQPSTDLKNDITLTDLSSKLVLLTLSFPNLRIIWSSSPYETAAIFRDLKSSHDEPDVEAAVLIGAESIDDVNSMTNLTPQEILRSMPGINSKNFRLVMSKVENIEDLSKVSVEDLKEILGQEAGSKLHRFIHKRE
ncbi:hypothetical protein K450DRAFT_257648 [Umbelopsis ramanniana AG]|uniref:ERCC4 domain-containing protein n=1 Tax=Umbelopsis ramanniana AG TaxID=1314678 RepID=A0AAD5E419_UMBRA|nr:uncharacterized protein K450DRAFT_257648 [Umbelopsis ramanniana AG]KAI8576312.1 hypothetical protein K450DRAFT_257648 [Umbelopsis ramanniana AG]